MAGIRIATPEESVGKIRGVPAPIETVYVEDVVVPRTFTLKQLDMQINSLTKQLSDIQAKIDELNAKKETINSLKVEG